MNTRPSTAHIIRQHFENTGNWPRADALIDLTGRPAAEVKLRLDALAARGVIEMLPDGRYRIARATGVAVSHEL